MPEPNNVPLGTGTLARFRAIGDRHLGTTMTYGQSKAPITDGTRPIQTMYQQARLVADIGHHSDDKGPIGILGLAGLEELSVQLFLVDGAELHDGVEAHR